MKAALPRALALVLLGLLSASPAWGWGTQGHRIVGAVADELLDSATSAALREIAGDRTLEEIGLALDHDKRELEERLPGSSRWQPAWGSSLLEACLILQTVGACLPRLPRFCGWGRLGWWGTKASDIALHTEGAISARAQRVPLENTS